MKSTIKKVLGLALASVLAISLTAEPAVAAVEKVDAPEQVSLYVAIPQNGYTTTSFSVLVPEYKKVTSVKSSKKDAVKLSYVERSKSTWGYDEDYYDEDGKKSNSYKYESENFYNYIGVRIYKYGTSTISYKYDGTTYKTKVTAKKWANPVKSLSISGVNSGKNIASKTKTASSVSGLKIAKSVNGATLKVTASDGWKISDVQYSIQKKEKYSYGSGDNDWYYNYNTKESHSASPAGASSATLYIGNLTKGGCGYARVSFYNSTDGGYETVYYYIGR